MIGIPSFGVAIALYAFLKTLSSSNFIRLPSRRSGWSCFRKIVSNHLELTFEDTNLSKFKHIRMDSSQRPLYKHVCPLHERTNH